LYPRLLFFRISIPATGFLSALPAANRSIWSAHLFINYVNANPKAFFDAEVMHVWTLGLAPYADEKFKRNFRHNSFFITDNTREAVNAGLADYSSIFFSQIPSLFYRGMVKVDVALIQTSAPDEHGYVSLGISVDIVKATVENAKLVIA